jgi:catechol 2,3-dioxygenase-like lactoylglutathione lyase family enzyme
VLLAGNLYIEVFEYSSPPGRPSDPERPVSDHGYTHFCIDVTDIDAEYARLTAAGMRFHTPPPAASDMGGRIRATYGRDPDGNVIELQEILDPTYPKRLDLG